MDTISTEHEPAVVRRFNELAIAYDKLLSAEVLKGRLGHEEWEMREEAAAAAVLDQAAKVACSPAMSITAILSKLNWLHRMMTDEFGSEPGDWDKIYLATLAGVIKDIRKLSDA